jgi:hypothetical protein
VPDDSASTYPRGFPEATLLTNGLRIETLADPVRDGLATARTETEKATTGKARWDRIAIADAPDAAARGCPDSRLGCWRCVAGSPR